MNLGFKLLFQEETSVTETSLEKTSSLWNWLLESWVVSIGSRPDTHEKKGNLPDDLHAYNWPQIWLHHINSSGVQPPWSSWWEIPHVLSIQLTPLLFVPCYFLGCRASIMFFFFLKHGFVGVMNSAQDLFRYKFIKFYVYFTKFSLVERLIGWFLFQLTRISYGKCFSLI